MAFERFEVVTVKEALTGGISRLSHARLADRIGSVLGSFGHPAKTAVIENDYIDLDYSASYYEQRGRSFTPTSRGTTRVHFFADDLTKRRLVNAGEHTVRAMKSSYLGFTVVRPDHPTTLGRTLLACPTDIAGKSARFPTRGTTSVDLAGIPLAIESCPFVSQDEKIMACATAALWMSTGPLAEKISGVAQHTTAEITGMAMSLHRPFGPAVGGRGLTIPEMEQALLRIGFDPSIYFYPTAQALVEICHLFSDSGIPPILTIETNGGRHAVTVVGYTLSSPASLQYSAPGVLSSHQFVSELIIHDDQRGMYLLAKVRPPTNPSSKLKAELEIQTDMGPEIALCDAILVPLPGRVMLDVRDIKTQAEEWINQGKLLNLIEDRDVVYRIILVRSNVFKQTLLERRHKGGSSDGYPNSFVTFARGLPMPRYVWLVEVSYSNDWDPDDRDSPPVIADFVFDSTMTAIMRLDYLLLHFPRTILGREVNGHNLRFLRGSNPGSHAHPPFPDVPRP